MKTALLTLCALTAGAALAAPRFIGAQEYGVRPGHELIWRVPVHGATTVEAVSLPEGLTFDAARRTLRGRLEKAGDHAVVLRASDGKEHHERNCLFPHHRLTTVDNTALAVALKAFLGKGRTSF